MPEDQSPTHVNPPESDKDWFWWILGALAIAALLWWFFFRGDPVQMIPARTVDVSSDYLICVAGTPYPDGRPNPRYCMPVDAFNEMQRIAR